MRIAAWREGEAGDVGFWMEPREDLWWWKAMTLAFSALSYRSPTKKDYQKVKFGLLPHSVQAI